jgi:isopenicillin N synthase-like dioxygenase
MGTLATVDLAALECGDAKEQRRVRNAAHDAGAFFVTHSPFFRGYSAAGTASRHRVTNPLDGSSRYSVSYFLNPRLDYAGYGEDALAVVLRSHPRTALRFYADLLPVT